MSFEKDRLSIRLSLKPEAIEPVFSAASPSHTTPGSGSVAAKKMPVDKLWLGARIGNGFVWQEAHHGQGLVRIGPVMNERI